MPIKAPSQPPILLRPSCWRDPNAAHPRNEAGAIRVSLVRPPTAKEPVIEARVVSLASVADAASDTRIVRIEFENREHSPAGRTVSIWIEPPRGIPH
jgi:hypothetical protein